MGIDVREIIRERDGKPDLETIREITDAIDFEIKIIRHMGAYAAFEPEKPKVFEGISPKKRPIRRMIQQKDPHYLLNDSPEEIFELIRQSTENGDLAEAIRISQCAYRYYGLSYA